MLINFKFNNVYSFNDMQEFSMVAGTTKNHAERLIDCVDYKALQFASIFGANASGKSNFVKVFELMQNLLLSGLSQKYYGNYYKFQDKESMKPTYLETILRINDKDYSYGFECDLYHNVFISEWLIELNKGEDTPIFENDFLTHVCKFNNLSIRTIELLDLYYQDIKSNNSILLLSFLNQNKERLYDYQDANIFKEVYCFFSKSLNIVGPTTLITSGDYYKINEQLEMLSKYLNFFDTGITKIKKIKKKFEEVIDIIPINNINILKRNALKKLIIDDKISSYSTLFIFGINFWLMSVSRTEEIIFEKICFEHKTNNEYILELKEESDGTIRILNLAGILLTTEKNQVFVIDEFDNCLHPQLTNKFIKIFLQKAENENNNNQLIITSHESSLLNFELLRRDEIWFINKKESKSEIYSLEEFNVRFDKRIDKAYLEGRFGGIPIFDMIFPEKLDLDEDKGK